MLSGLAEVTRWANALSRFRELTDFARPSLHILSLNYHKPSTLG